jgi:N-acetylglucosamine repressor
MPKVADQWLKDVLIALYQRQAVTRDEILQVTGLNPASASHALQYLLAVGTIQKMGSLKSSGGRRRELLKLNPEAGYFLAMDLDTTRIRFALTNLIGDIRYREEQDLDFGNEMKIRCLLDGLERVQRNLAPWQRARVLAVGIAHPGVVDASGLVTAVNLGWCKFPLAEQLRQVTPLPVFLETWCRTYILAEKWLGQAQDCNNCIFVELGRGVGAGIVAADHYVEGSNQMAGEFGHITIDMEAADECLCGKRGCLEAIASGPNIIRQYLQLLNGSRRGNKGMQLSAVLEKARNDDPLALQVVNRVSRALGLGLSHLVLLLNPGLIILGGDLMQGEDLLLPRIRKELAMHVPGFMRTTELRVTSLGQDIGLKGAASLAFRNSVQNSDLLKKLCRPLSETLDTRKPLSGPRLARSLTRA